MRAFFISRGYASRVPASSRASSLPQGWLWNTDFVYTINTCGTELARDEASKCDKTYRLEMR